MKVMLVSLEPGERIAPHPEENRAVFSVLAGIAWIPIATLWFGYGMYDFVKLRSIYSLFPDEEGNLVLLSQARRPEGSLYEYLIKLSEAGVPFTNIELPFGHDWVLWRMAIVDAFDNVLWK